MISVTSPEERVRGEIAKLRVRLEEAEETLRALRSGEVQAPGVDTADEPQIFTLQGLDAESNRFGGEILAQVSDSVIAVDREERITFFNAAAERQYGVRSDDVLGRRISEIYTRHWPNPEAEAARHRALREHGQWRGESVQRLHDGRELHVESSVAVLRGADGANEGIVAAIRDITARKQAEADLRQSEYFLQRVTDVTPGVIHVFDLERRCSVFANRSVADELGYTPEEISAMGADAVPTLMHPEDFARFPAHLDQVRALRDEEIAEFEHRMRDKSGKWQWFHSRDAVFKRDADGTVCQLIGTAIEITARKKAETKLVDATRRFEFALRSSPVTLFHQDSDLHYTWIYNPAFGYNPEQVIGKRDGDLFERAQDAANTEAMKREVLRTGASERRDVLVHAEGVDRFYDLLVEPMVDKDGSITGVTCAAIDVTERRRNAAEAQRVSALLDTILHTAPIGFCFLDPDLRYVRINERLAEMNGISAQAHLGRHVSEIVPGLLEPIHAVTDRILATGEPVLNHEFSGETPAAPGLTRFWNESWYPVRDSAGEVMGFGAVIEEITERKQADMALRVSEHRMRLAMEASATGLWEWDVNTDSVTWSSECYVIHGLREGEFYGSAAAFDRLIHPDDRDRVWATVRAGIDRRQKYVGEFRIVRPDGEVRWVTNLGRAVYDEQERPLRMIGTVTDITDRKRSEDALRESEQFTRRVLDNLFAFVGVTTADGTLTDVNRAPMEAAGIPASEVLGKKFWDCYWWSYSPEIQAQLRHACERAGSGEVVRYDVVVRMAGDTRMWIDFQIAPLRDQEGRITHLIPSAMDITVRRAADEKLRASEERTRLATEATAVGIWERNVHTDAIRWDAQMFRIYGIAPTADGFVHYRDWSSAVLPEDLPENERILQDTVRTCGQSRREFRIQRRDDSAMRHIASVETVRANAQGETEWLVGTNLDVTERKTAEIRLRQLAADMSEADRRKDEFLATLAHELRNPLAPIRTGLQLMKMKGVPAATVERTRSMMERQLTQMVRLVDDLMDVSRISRGKLELRKERVALAAVVNSAVETSRPLIEQMGHQLTVTLPQQALMVDADMTRLAQVFLNLLNNASKYSDRGGHIQLNVERQGRDAVVTAKDTGIGISANQLPLIFEMFTQVDKSLEKSQGGLGIGLTLVKRLVDMHGGSVEARSDGPGKGSEFIVRLPLLVEASGPQASGVEYETAAPMSSLRILVVDDNRDGADSLSEMLKMMGNDTRTAYDGQAGVEAAGEFRPDVILLDIGLPKLNGHEACRRIREQAGGKSVVLIAVTGWGQDDDRRRSRVAGFDHHMVKPVDPRELMELLAGLQIAKQ